MLEGVSRREAYFSVLTRPQCLFPAFGKTLQIHCGTLQTLRLIIDKLIFLRYERDLNGLFRNR